LLSFEYYNAEFSGKGGM